MLMEILTQTRPVFDYSEDTAHTVEIIREENEHGELGSFGFTLQYEKPPVVGTIVPGEFVDWLVTLLYRAGW